MTDTWTHEFTRSVPVPAARLFEAFTTESELEQWFAERARVEPRLGGAFRFWGRHTIGTPTASAATGTVTAFEQNALLGFEWTICRVPSTVTISFTPDSAKPDEVTSVSIHHELRGALDQPRPKELIDDWWRFTLGNLVAWTTQNGEVLRPDFSDTNPEIRLSMTVDAPCEAVFQALIDPEALRTWMGAPAPVVEPKVGGRYELGWRYQVDGKDVAGGPMRILDIVPNQRLVVDWPDWRGDATVPMQSITWLLEPHGDGTRLTLIHAGFTRTVDFSDYPFGWGHFMGELAKVSVAIGVDDR